MKVCLLLTGFTRSHVQNFNSIKNFILDKYDTDVYFATWNKTQSNINSFLQESNEQEIKSLYKKQLKNFCVFDFDEYNKNKITTTFVDRENDVFKTNQRAIEHGSFWVERLKDQWFLVDKAINLVDNNYDILIRLRFDINLLNFSLLRKEFVIPQPHPINPYTDHMAYGNFHNMKKYCSLYSNIELLYKNYNLDISFAEHMLKFYMEEVDPKIFAYVDNSIRYEIIK